MDPKSTPGEKRENCSSKMLTFFLGDLLGADLELPRN
jgi:hypothetical protein